MADYDTVYQYRDGTFTGIPLAKVHHGTWYWPDYQAARDFAECFGLPTDRIIPYTRGWAIQLRKSGPYVEIPQQG